MRCGNVLLLAVCLGYVQAECLDAWTIYGDSCYHHGHTDSSFIDASRYCQHFGAELVNIESKTENDFIRSYLSDLKDSNHWIGCTDEVVEGVWKLYPSEETAPYLNWGHDQPNNGRVSNCVAIWASFGYHWVDEPCTRLFKPLCEMPYCRHFGAELVNIESKTENDFIRSYLADLKDPKHWIGCTDEVIEGVWKFYLSEVTATFLDFGAGQPEQGKAANCVAIWASFNYHWVDEPCGNRFKPLCEMSAQRETPVIG